MPSAQTPNVFDIEQAQCSEQKKQLTVLNSKLREALKLRGLQTTGLKKALVKRLSDFVKKGK